MKRYQTRMGLVVGLAVLGMPLTVNAQPFRSSQLRRTSPLEQANELNQQVIERYQAVIPLAEEAPVLPQLLAANHHSDLTTSLNSLVGLPSANSSTMFPVQANPPSPQLAQVTPNTVTGQLDETSNLAEDGRRVNFHRIAGNAGETLTIELVTDGFDALLFRYDSETNIVIGDVASSGASATLGVTLPSDGMFAVGVMGLDTEDIGNYQISWRGDAVVLEQIDAEQRAIAFGQRATELHQAGQYEDAIPLAQEALSIRREQFGNRHPEVARSLNNLAALYQDQGRYEEAESVFQEALSINREQLGGRHPEVAHNLNNLAVLYKDQGRYEEAETLFQESLAIRREQFGNRHPDVASSLNNLAALYQDQGRYSNAETLYQESLVIRREQLGERHLDVANSLSNLATLYQDQGSYEEADLLYQESLVIRREQLGESHPSVANTLNNLAALYRLQGRYAEAETYYGEALAIRRGQLREHHPSVANTLNNLAELYYTQGRYGEAEPLYQEALTINREQLGERHPSVATSLNNLAELYYSQGRYEEASSNYLGALSIYREQLGENHPSVSSSLNNLAALYQAQGRYREAEPLYQEALTINREQLGERHLSVATNLNNLAALYIKQGRYGEAELLFKESLIIRREQLGANHPEVATNLHNLAALYQAQGRYGEAEPLYQEALTVNREQLGERHPSVATNLNNLATLYEAQGSFAQAIRTFQIGLEIEEWHLDVNLASLTDTQRQDYAATLEGSTNRAISISFQAPEAQPFGLVTLLRRKGRLLEAGSRSLKRLRQNLTQADQTVLDDFIAVRQQLAALTFNPPPDLPPEQYRQQLAQLEAEATELEKTLVQRSAVFRVETQPVDMATVQAQIPTDGVLVEYARYRPFDAQADRFGDPRYAAYLLFPDGRMAVMELGDAAEIDAAVLSLAKALEDPNQSVDEIQRRARALDALVMAPLREPLEGVEHLLISPDGALNQIPFEVLRSNRGQYLIETFEISYLTSGRDLLKLDLIPPSPNPPLILAAPSYGEIVAAAPDDNGQRSVDLATLTVGPLEYAFREGSALSALLPDADFLTGRDATETALKQSQAPRLLHIATHGLFLEDAPRRQENGDAESTVFNGPYEVPIENPLLRAMLALEGFNARKSGQEDGILTALEAASLNLYGTQLVVLSACETAQGEAVSGEGVYGLRRAFTLAGAESLVLSLWNVKDDSTQELMVGYYDNLLSGMGRSEALRQVQLEMIHSDDYSHPYYWAAFMLTGDWRSLNTLN